MRTGVGQPQLHDPAGEQAQRPALVPGGRRSTGFGDETRLGLLAQEAWAAGPPAVFERGQARLVEAAARALDRQESDAQRGADLRVARAILRAVVLPRLPRRISLCKAARSSSLNLTRYFFILRSRRAPTDAAATRPARSVALTLTETRTG
jgi:hypothetical protein